MNAVLMNLAMAKGKWDITTFLTNVTKQLQTWGGLIIVLIGTVMIIWSIYKLATGLLGGGRQDVNRFKIEAAFLVGGAFVAAGAGGAWTFVQGIASGGKDTIENLGSTVMFQYFR